jgi:hypothetical protein
MRGYRAGKGECVDDGTTTDRRDIARLADNRRLACRREAEKGKADVVLRTATPDPPGGKIARDASGTPTGSFADSAAIFVSEKGRDHRESRIRETRRSGRAGEAGDWWDEREGRIHEWLKRD